MSAPFTPLQSFQNKVDGSIVFASDWNNWIGSLYAYITGTFLPQFNVLNNKGDMWIYNGMSLVQLAVGSDGQVLTANSGTGSGVSWGSGGGLPITTKGDLVVGNGSG